MSIFANIFNLAFGGKKVDNQNPLAVNQDSIYPSDIDFDNSDFTNWTGVDTEELFESPFSASITNSTANNPKSIIIAFKRTMNAIQIGLGENNGGNFSNVKISLLGSSGFNRAEYDNSLDNTKKNSLNAIIGGELFNAVKIEFYTSDPISISNITIQKANYSVIGNDVQNPVATDGDTIYAKDIDLKNCNLYTFEGDIIDLFTGLNTNVIDSTSNNPKTILVVFKRTFVTPLLGIGENAGGSFSNVKLTAIVSGGYEITLSDSSDDNTDRTTQTFYFPNTGINALKIEFYTSDPISISNLFIPKLIAVSSYPDTPVVYPSEYLSPYMLNGASQNMAVNGSITPVDFIYTVSGYLPARWIRNFIDLQDGAAVFLPENFGAITGGLTNGVDIIVQKDNVEYVIENWKTNMDISMTMYDFTAPYRAGSYIGRWTMTNDLNGVPITLFSGDQIIIRINDDLTLLDQFRFRAKLRQ